MTPDPSQSVAGALSGRLVGETLAALRSRLAAIAEQPLLEALLILSDATRLPKTWVLAHPGSILTEPQYQITEELARRRSEGQALPYLLGRWEFFGLEFYITPDVLIPRPETEILVETALNWLRSHPERRQALDIGAGSGCIGISLALNVNRLWVAAGEVSAPAIKVGRENAARLGVPDCLAWYLGDLTLPISGLFDLVCANLPYIPGPKMAGLLTARNEPALALDGGPDGLACIRRLLADAPRITAPGGLVLLEIESGQGSAAAEFARLAFPTAEISILPDLAGLDRVLSIQAA